MFSVLRFCLVTSFLFVSLPINPTGAECSQLKQYTIDYPNNADVEGCEWCPICPPGQGLAVQCGSKVKNGTFLGCMKCENGTYSDSNDTSHCKSCDQCGYRITLGKCTPTKNSNCSTTSCIDGYYMDDVLDTCVPLPIKIQTTLVKNNSTIEPTKTPVPTKSPRTLASVDKNATNSTAAVTMVTTVTAVAMETAVTIPITATAHARPTLQSKPAKSTTVHPDNNNKVALIIPIIGGCLLGAVFTLCIGKKLKQSCFIWSSRAHFDHEGAEGGEEIPLTEHETEDHLINKFSNEIDGTSTLYLVDDDDKNLAITFPTDSLVSDTIVNNVHVMDELSRGLDQPVYQGGQYWVHLAAEFHVPEDVQMKFQHSLESSPSKSMLEIKEGFKTNFSIQELKDGLSAISRNDLVRKVETCHHSNAATLQEFREKHPVTLESICLQLDHHNHWKALGRKINIPEETLQRIATSSSCAKTVLEIIETINPKFTVMEMQAVLKQMQRKDVCKVLDEHLLVRDTIATLRETLDCLEMVAALLDKETPGMKNWLHFALRCGVPKKQCDILTPKANPSPTKALVEHIVQDDPDLTVEAFISALVKMKRTDVAKAIGEIICASKETD